MSEYLRIKQLMPIPEHLAALTQVVTDGITVWEDLVDSGWPQFIALVEGDHQTDDRICLYQADITGDVEMMEGYMLVYKRNCPECGGPMRVFAYADYPNVLHYHCDCGHHIEVKDIEDVILKKQS